jgi:hypothetical protein
VATGFTKNFVVKNGITTGPITLDAGTGNITGTNLSVTGVSDLGAIANIIITGGSSGQTIVTDGAGNLSFANASAASTPAPMPTYVAVGDDLLIAANYQGLFGYPITIDGTMTVDGVLIDVNDNGNGGGGGGTAIALNATIANVSITGGTSGYYLQTDGAGTLSWAAGGGGGGGSPGGVTTQVQFNDAGSFAGNTGFTFNKTTGVFTSPFLSGNGNGLSNIQGANVSGQVTYAETANSVAAANVSGTVANATYAVTAGTSGTVTTAAQPNITSTGTLASLSITGNANVGNVGTTNLVTTGTGSFGANINMNSNWITNVGYPNLATDAASKSYVDTIVSTGITYHQPVNVATTTTLATATGGTTSYVSPNGAANGIGAYISTTGTYLNIDGANVQTVGTRILVKNEANAAWNGVYTYANTTTIVRSTDTDTYGVDTSGTDHISINDYFFTLSGTVNEGTAFIVSAPTGVIIFGTSNIEFSTFSTSQVYDAGTGINITGTTISANASQTQITAVGTLTSLSVSGNANVGNIGATNGVFTNISGDGADILNIAGTHVTGQVGYAEVANAVAVANVTGIGNIATTNYNGNGSQVLAGNGAWITQSSGGGSSISNGTSNVNIATSNGDVTITANSNTIVTVSGTGANITGNVNLGNVGNVHITGGQSGQLLSTDGSGNLTWATNNAITGIQEFNASASQTVFTVSGGYTPGAVLVFVNGIQMNNGDYTATNGTTVILTDPRVAGDVVRIISSVAAPSFNVSSIQNFSVAMSIALGI